MDEKKRTPRKKERWVKGRERPWICLWYFLSLASLVSMNGCAGMQEAGVPQWSGSGFLSKEFLEHRKVAILPFDGDPKGEVSDTFRRSFQERFPQVVLVGRKQILERFEEKDLYYGRLDKRTRTEIRKTFDVQAVIMGSVYYPSIVRWLLQVVIVDTETDAVLGRSYVEINYIGAEGMKKGCELSIQKLVVR